MSSASVIDDLPAMRAARLGFVDGNGVSEPKDVG
jgi:hypothetical protein